MEMSGEMSDDMVSEIVDMVIDKWAGTLEQYKEDWLRSNNMYDAVFCEHNEFLTAKFLFRRTRLIHPEVQLPRSKARAIAKAKMLVRSNFFHSDKGGMGPSYTLGAL